VIRHGGRTERGREKLEGEKVTEEQNGKAEARS